MNRKKKNLWNWASPHHTIVWHLLDTNNHDDLDYSETQAPNYNEINSCVCDHYVSEIKTPCAAEENISEDP